MRNPEYLHDEITALLRHGDEQAKKKPFPRQIMQEITTDINRLFREQMDVIRALGPNTPHPTFNLGHPRPWWMSREP